MHIIPDKERCFMNIHDTIATIQELKDITQQLVDAPIQA